LGCDSVSAVSCVHACLQVIRRANQVVADNVSLKVMYNSAISKD
jgi:hypothetical protein